MCSSVQIIQVETNAQVGIQEGKLGHQIAFRTVYISGSKPRTLCKPNLF